MKKTLNAAPILFLLLIFNINCRQIKIEKNDWIVLKKLVFLFHMTKLRLALSNTVREIGFEASKSEIFSTGK